MKKILFVIQEKHTKEFLGWSGETYIDLFDIEHINYLESIDDAMQEIKSLDEPENFEIKVVEISFEVLK
jgi:hypothetical protein